MEQKIIIPQPCHENWDTMLPEEQGRHCLSCCKTVIDFSDWHTEDILAYIQNKNGERVCGRFKNEQLTKATDKDLKRIWLREIFVANLSFLKKIAAVIIVCFGLLHSSNTYGQKGQTTVGKTKLDKAQSFSFGRPTISKNDTIKKEPEERPTVSTVTAGIILLPPNPTKTSKNQYDKKVVQNPPAKKETK